MTRRFLTAVVLMLTAALTFAQPERITLSTADRLAQVAQYGMGAPQKFDISVDGSRFGVAMGVGGVRVYDTANLATPLAVFGTPDGDARDIDFAFDNRVAVAYANGDVVLYDGVTFAETATLTGHERAVIAVDFSPDGSKLASGSWDNSVRVWDTTNGQALLNLPLDYWGASVAFSPDGTKLAAGDSAARLYDAASGEVIADLTTHTSTLGDLAFTPDSTMLVTASNDMTLKLWDAASGAEKLTLTGHTSAPRAITFDLENHLVTSGFDLTLRRWDMTTGQELSNTPILTNFVTMAVLPDGRIIGGSLELGVIVLDSALNDQHIQTDIRSKMTALGFSPDGRVALGYRSGEIELVDAVAGTAETVIAADYVALGSVRDLSYTADSRYLVVGYASNTLRVYQTRDYALVAETQTGTSFSKLYLDAAGQRVATTGRITAVYSLPDLALLADLGLSESTNTLAFSPDGGQLAVGDRAVGVTLFDAVTYQAQPVVIPPPAKVGFENASPVVTRVTYTPDGAQVLISWNHYTTGLYDPQTGIAVRETDLEYDLAQAIILAPDDSFMMFLDYRELIVIDWASVQLVVKISDAFETSGIGGAFNRSSTYLYTLSDESVVRVWGIV